MQRQMSTSKRVLLWMTIFLSCFFAACTKKSSDEKVVNLAIWGNYLSKAAADRFTAKTGIQIHIMNYSSNEELLAKVQSGGAGIDVAVPSDYMVDVMTKLNLLEALDKDKIPAARDLSKDVLKQPFDPENRFSLPYAWNVVGIAVNRDLYKEPITSWKDLLDNPRLKGKFALLDDVREVTAAVLEMRGKNVNTIDTSDLVLAREDLMRIKKDVKMFTSDTVDILKNKEVIAAQAYSPDALQAGVKTNGVIEFVIPKEGSTRSIDNLVIIKGAKHLASSHELINFLLQRENDADFVKTLRAGPVVEGLKSSLPPELQTNATLFPSAEVLSRLVRLHDLGDQNRLYEEIWTAVKSAE